MRKSGKELSLFAILLALGVFSTTVNHDIIKPENLQNTGRLIGIYGIFSIGMGFAIITGGIDLSVGSLFAFLGVILAWMLTVWHWDPALAGAAVILLGIALGFLHGTLITRVKMQPFVVTLCGLLIYRGLARVIPGDSTMGFGEGKGFEWMKNMALGSVFGVPIPFIILIFVAAAAWFLLHKSVYGRHLFAAGQNEESARFAGINTRRVIGTTYVICSGLAAVAAILLAFYTNSISPSVHGSFYELYAIAAAVLGGCSLRGGEGSIIGILLGTALLQEIRNLVNFLRIPSSLEFAVMGVVILIGVLIDNLLARRQAKGV